MQQIRMMLVSPSFSSQEHDITANGLVTWSDRVRLVEGHTENLELSYSSPTLTIRGANGSDLSSSNPGIVVIRIAQKIYKFSH